MLLQGCDSNGSDGRNRVSNTEAVVIAITTMQFRGDLDGEGRVIWSRTWHVQKAEAPQFFQIVETFLEVL